MKRHAHLLMATAIVLALPLSLNSGSLASEVLIYAMAAMGCNLLLGQAGLLSFGQGVFFGLGSYTVGLLLVRWPLPMPLALACAIGLGALGALVMGWVAIRQRGTYFVMLTLAFAQMFYFAAYTASGLTGGDNGLLDIPRPPLALGSRILWDLSTPWRYYALVAVLFLAVFALLQRASESLFGRTLLALRDNEDRAAAIGYDPRRFKLLAFVISGAITGLAGALHAMMTGVAPLSSAEYHMSETILLITVLGGTGKLLASVLGAVFYVLMSDWLSTLWPRWLLLLGLLLMLVSTSMPRGLWGLVEWAVRAWAWVWAKTGERHQESTR